MRGGEFYTRSLAAGLAVFLGGCGTQLKNETQTDSVQNPPESSQPKVPFIPGRCARFAVELAVGKTRGQTINDNEGSSSYFISNRGHWTPPHTPTGQTSLNTVEFTHAYEDNAGHQTDTDYIYNYGERTIDYKNNESARVAVVKMEDGTVGATGWVCE